MANEPNLLLADESTGGLNSVTAGEVLSHLRTFDREFGLTIILVTQDVALAAKVDRTIAIRVGCTSAETIRRDASLTVTHEHTPATSAIIGLPNEMHLESILIDRVGWLQLPKEYIVSIPFKRRAKVRIVQGHVELWPISTSINGSLNGEMLQSLNLILRKVTE